MKIAVCIKPTATGEWNHFEGAAYESALRIEGAEVILLSMAPLSATDFLRMQTRLGAKEAVLLSDPAFAGSDTLATSYVLSLALEKIKPDFVFCGRQTLEGDTAQVGVGLATRLGFDCVTRVMEISPQKEGIWVRTREGEERLLSSPALLTFERICAPRLPSIFSKAKEVQVWRAADIAADLQKCGQQGSPTKVVKSFENSKDKRHCQMISLQEAPALLRRLLAEPPVVLPKKSDGKEKLSAVWVYGEKALPLAQTVGENPLLKPLDKATAIAADIRQNQPDAVIWESTGKYKEVSAAVAVLLETGLCADCVALETKGKELLMTRPAFGGNIMATIACRTKPAMATVRTESASSDLILSVGLGCANEADFAKEVALAWQAELTGSRAVIDAGILPYENQVGLTGKTVSPKVYVAMGISGAVHHLAGIRGAKHIIAVNTDRTAPIFDYADYGILADTAAFLREMKKG